MAEGWYNHYTDSYQGSSAGTNPITIHMFRQPTDEAIQVMAEEGVDISHQTVKPVTPEMVEQADKVVVFCDLDECPEFIVNSPKTIHRPVPDPFAKNIDEYRSAREQIRLIVQELIKQQTDR